MDDVVIKRILMSKEFYLNGVELARNIDPLSKMMAVHNFHIAIEIAVKSILLNYEIRNDKTLNIDFESMLNEIDKHPLFKEKGQKLPYRQEIRNLNQMRNLVQHHVIEPDESSMEDWRLFSSRFLTKVFDGYFNVNFDNVNRITFVNNEGLKKYLDVAMNYLKEKNFEPATSYAAAAFEFASFSISDFIPKSSSSFFVGVSLDRSEINSRYLKDAFDKTHERIDESEHFSVLLASGLSLSEYKKFKSSVPHVAISINGNPLFQTGSQQEFNNETTVWVIDFVISTIVKWQQLGLSPKITEFRSEGAFRHIEEEMNKIKA